MDYHQLTKVVILLCITGNALAGLLPDGGAGRNNGYQYNRPGGSGFGGAGSGFGGPGGVGGGDVRARPTTFYGPPGAGGDGAGFGGRPGGRYQDGGYQGGFGGGFGRDNGPPQPYNFQYQVYDPPSGNDYSQRESSDGNTVQGEYRVLLPDSRTQIVKYMADDANGYTADVQYEGQAQFSRGGGGAGGGAGGYQGGNEGYQRGGSGYDRTGGGYQGGAPGRFDGGYQGGRPGGFGADAASNQYLPPRNGYSK